VAYLSVGSEYFINSQELENKVRDLLPSQGGAGAGFDLSASTQIIPIIDLTESAEGSNIRQDLQTSLSFKSITSFNVNNTTSTIINNTGYFRVFGTCNFKSRAAGSDSIDFILNDGASDKSINNIFIASGQDNNYLLESFDFIVFLEAGDLLKITATFNASVFGSTRQIASIDGTLVNP